MFRNIFLHSNSKLTLDQIFLPCEKIYHNLGGINHNNLKIENSLLFCINFNLGIHTLYQLYQNLQ